MYINCKKIEYLIKYTSSQRINLKILSYSIILLSLKIIYQYFLVIKKLVTFEPC